MNPSEIPSPQVVLLGATFDTGNRGVSALAAGAIRCIRERFPGASVTLMDYAKTASVHKLKLESGQELAVPKVNMRFSKKVYLSNNIAWLLFLAVFLKLIPVRQLREFVVSRNLCLRTIENAVCVASLAGGDSFSDIYGMGRLLYVSLPQILVLLLSRKLLLLPQTIGPFQRRSARIIARYILSHADTVYSRELHGCEEVHSLLSGGTEPRQLAFCHDVGFILTPMAPPDSVVPGIGSLAEAKAAPLVGINISGLLLMGGYNRKNMFGLSVNYGTLVDRIIEILMTNTNAAVILVPHVMGEDHESDSAACERVYQQFKDRYAGRIGVVRGCYNESEIKYVIGLCDYFIGSRMHACIAALSQCVPSTAIAYSDKFIGVLGTIGIDSVVADARRLDEDGIVRAIASSYEIRQTTRRRLEERIPQIKESILNFFRANATEPVRMI